MSITSTIPFASFWPSPWSATLRASCKWLKRDPAPIVPYTPDALAPGWLRPLCVQRWVGQAIAARFAWLRQHPEKGVHMFHDETLPRWTRADWKPYTWRLLRGCHADSLSELFLFNVERLLRIMRLPPALMGEEVWTRAALSACERLTQVYQELQRRSGTRAARQTVHELLNAYIIFAPANEAEVSNAQADPSPDVVHVQERVPAPF